MFCMKCGAKNADGAKFCVECGKSLEIVENPSASGASIPTSAPQPQPAPHSAPASYPAPAPMPAAAARPETKPAASVATIAAAVNPTAARKKLIIALIASAAAICLIVAGFFIYNTVAVRPLPKETDLAGAKDDDAPTIAVVQEKLKSKGIRSTVKKVYAGTPKGTFAGYVGVKAGQQVHPTQTVTIGESLGPGIPKGTKGKPLQAAYEQVANMNVPVTAKKIIVSSSSKVKTGTVLETYPTDGAAVKDLKKGIFLAVAEHGTGVPIDIVGQSKETAQKSLEAAGYKVIAKARFSSTKNIGKVVGSDPAPGAAASAGDTITLEYGVAAKDMDTAFYETVDDEVAGLNMNDAPDAGFYSTSVPVAANGRYCTTKGKCLTLETTFDGKASSAITSGKDSSSVQVCLTQDGWCYSKSVLTGEFADDYHPEKNKLYASDIGAFEFYPESAEALYCGNDAMYPSAGGWTCQNGQFVDGDGPASGASYRMTPMYVYFAAGADLRKLESSNYFTQSAVEAAAKAKPVDTSKPFIIARDPSLYKETSVSITDVYAPNPFLPWNKGAVKFQPAPDNDDVYYLVEDNAIDWSGLANEELPQVNSSSNSSVGVEKTYTPAEITAAVKKGDFKPIAGKYCTNGKQGAKECAVISETGEISGENGLTGKAINPQKLQDGAWGESAGNYLSFSGPDSEYRCTGDDGAIHSGADCYGKYFTFEAAISQRPVSLLYYFKGASKDSMIANESGIFDPTSSWPGEKTPDNSRAFIYFIGYRMIPAPTENRVYYKQ